MCWPGCLEWLLFRLFLEADQEKMGVDDQPVEAVADWLVADFEQGDGKALDCNNAKSLEQHELVAAAQLEHL